MTTEDNNNDDDNRESSVAATTSTVDIESFVRNAPKIELHVHLDGCFDPNILWKHLREHPEMIRRVPVEKNLPWKDPDKTPPVKLRESISNCATSLDYARLCTCRKRYRQQQTRGGEGNDNNRQQREGGGSLEDMLLCFEHFLPLVRDNFDLLELLAYDFVRRQADQNVIYSEVRYSPHLLSETDPRKAHKSVTDGLRRGCIEYDGRITVNQILCGIDFRPDWSSDVIDMANEFRNDVPCPVVAVEVAAGESHFDKDSPFHKEHVTMCQKALRVSRVSQILRKIQTLYVKSRILCLEVFFAIRCWWGTHQI